MRGYKALNKSMRAIHGNRMQYEVNKLYSINGNVALCENGFHFCKDLEYISYYYDIKDSRIFEVEAYGEDIKSDGMKYAVKEIQLIRELTKEEINDYFKGKQQSLICSENWYVRRATAEQGYGLDVLIQDEVCYVRAAVAEQGYGLDILVHDRDWYVRRAVAAQGYGLDILIYDDDCNVRKAVAKQGYGLDVLIHDENGGIRRIVAEQGYGLNVLLYDTNHLVREAAEMMSNSSTTVKVRNFP